MEMYQIYVISFFVLVLCLVSIVHLYFRLFSLIRRKDEEYKTFRNEIINMFYVQNDLLTKIILNNKNQLPTTSLPNEKENNISVPAQENALLETKPVVDEAQVEIPNLTPASLVEIISFRRKT